MAEPTTELMEELLKMIDQQQPQELSGTQPLCSRLTKRLRRSPATNGIPASRTNFGVDFDDDVAKALSEGDVNQAGLLS